jgi:hypothetical protein
VAAQDGSAAILEFPRKKLRRIFAIQRERKKKLPPPTSGADHGFIALQVRQGPVAN